MLIEVYALSDVGRVREKNQDNFICNGVCAEPGNRDFRVSQRYESARPVLFGVFDGMGGLSHGEKASLIAARTAAEVMSGYGGGAPEAVQSRIYALSNYRLCREMSENIPGKTGTTASMLLLENGCYYISDLGDSPVFLIRDGRITEISFEHTEKQQYEAIFGKAPDPNKKFRLTQHLGISPEEMELAPFYASGALRDKDVFLICSDGLSDLVSPEEILQTVTAYPSLKQAAEALLQRALAVGGNDNVTILLIAANIAPQVQAFKPTKARKGSKALVTGLIALLSVLITAAVIILLCVLGGDPHDGAADASDTTVGIISSADEVVSEPVPPLL